MLATQTPDNGPSKDAKQWIKEKLSLSLKALQKRYVTTDAVVTSEDGDANLLCCALEAVFIQGIRSKHVRSEAGGRGRKGGSRRALPQPVFWSLLKTVTHRDVIKELEKLAFVSTDVGRCRAWLRLALNHGLVECYLTSLFREATKLQGHYQPCALLLDPEEREVLLSYLQGLASLTFHLSYKSAVLNEWTATPLALSGLCPASHADDALDLSPPGGGGGGSRRGRAESWDTESQSSSSGGSSDAVEVQRGGGGAGGSMPAGKGGVAGVKGHLSSSTLSLDTTGSSHLSDSLSSDSLLQGHDPRSADKEAWSCDSDVAGSSLEQGVKRPLKDVLADYREGVHSSQDSMQEDSYVSSSGPDAAFSGSDSEAQGPAAPSPGPTSPGPASSGHASSGHASPGPASSGPASSGPTSSGHASPGPASSDPPSPGREEPPAEERAPSDVLSGVPPSEGPSGPRGPVGKEEEGTRPHLPNAEAPPTEKNAENPPGSAPGSVADVGSLRSASVLSRKMSSDSLSHSHSWITEDDIYKPHLEELPDHDESPGSGSAQVNGFTSPPPPERDPPHSPPSVVHRRQIGLFNPFRGLLKLGHLERRSAVGMWRDHYCELSPFEFRLYLNAEERACCDNCSLLRCEGAHLTSPLDGRFELAFPGKRLCLRAADRGEAEDWVERVTEAVDKCRPRPADEQWEVLQMPAEPPPPPSSSSSSLSSASSVPSSPERTPAAAAAPEEEPTPPPLELDWTRPAALEPDSIKEAVLYLSTDPEGRVWAPLVFSLSLEALRGFRVEEGGRKVPRLSLPVDGVRDVVPDVALGGPAFFKILAARQTLRLRAESAEEARSWRALVRGALDSYLESGEDAAAGGGGGGGGGGYEGPGEAPGRGRGAGGGDGNLRRLVQHRLKGSGELLGHLCAVPAERGLDAQGFKCAGCPKQIGVNLGRARLCEFSGQYYCDSCHHGDTSIIPSRMVHNWDLTPREVSRKALQLLGEIQHEPLLEPDRLNPDLWEHATPMGHAHGLREKLRLLGDYLLTCRSTACKNVQARLDQRSYLLESSHLYSVLDLRQIAAGEYTAWLGGLIQLACSHVQHCDLCTQRGFICQLCHAQDIIFPFQFHSTSRCKECKAMFHSACKARSPSCPRCQRLQRYLERETEE